MCVCVCVCVCVCLSVCLSVCLCLCGRHAQYRCHTGGVTRCVAVRVRHTDVVTPEVSCVTALQRSLASRNRRVDAGSLDAYGPSTIQRVLRQFYFTRPRVVDASRRVAAHVTGERDAASVDPHSDAMRHAQPDGNATRDAPDERAETERPRPPRSFVSMQIYLSAKFLSMHSCDYDLTHAGCVTRCVRAYTASSHVTLGASCVAVTAQVKEHCDVA